MSGKNNNCQAANNYGFDENDEIHIPKPKPNSKTIKDALDAGKEKGFVDRSVNIERPRKKKVKQATLHIAGPEKGIFAFIEYAQDQGVPYWKALDELMKLSAK